MELKPDFDQACRRLGAWWNSDCLDRPAIAVTSPKAGSSSEPFPPPASLAQQWLDPDYVISKFEYEAERTFWGGEAIPKLWVNLGPGSLAAFLTGKYILAPDTVWFPEAVNSLSQILDLHLSDSNHYWAATKQLTQEAALRGRGRFHTSVTDIGGVTDVVASLRRNQNLLLDLVEQPGAVKQARDHILRLWLDVYRELYAITQNGQKGGASWLSPWSPGTHYPLQCDFSAMISPEMFAEFVLPEIQTLTQSLDNSAYHLDGPDAVKHLDLLLEIPRLNAIQWQPGAGNPMAVEWVELLKKIQKKGKAIWVNAEPQDVERILSYLRPEGVLIRTGCATEAEARDLLRQVERFSTKNRRSGAV